MFGFPEVFIGEVFILVLLIPVLTRPLFKKQKYADSVVMLSPLCLVLSVLLILIYGLSWSRIITIALSILVLFTNMRALQRFGSRLYVDYYSLAFRIAASIETLIIIFALVIFFVFRPLAADIYPQRMSYSGSVTHGFIREYTLFRPARLITYLYGSYAEDKPLIVFFPGTYMTAEDSELRLGACVQKGLTVFTGDFYGSAPGEGLYSSIFKYSAFKRFFLHRFMHKDGTDKGGEEQNRRQRLIEQRRREAEALLVLAGTFADSVIIAAEGDSLKTAAGLQQKYPGFVRGVFDASAGIKLYKRGIADLPLVQPLDAFFMFCTSEKETAGGSYIDTVQKFFALRDENRKSYTLFADALHLYTEALK